MGIPEAVLRVEILDTDQWTATGNIEGRSWEELKREGLDSVEGGDSLAARRIFGGFFDFKTVTAQAHPSIGHVWFHEVDGKAEVYRENLDSSD